MMRQVTIIVLVFWLLAAASSVCLAQGKSSPNADRKKGSCDFITQADAEAILSTPVEAKGDDGYGCWFSQVGWINQPPNNKSVRLNVWNWTSPQVNWYADTRKKRTATQVPGKVVKDLPDFADAAIWTWISGYGVFDAFKGGTIWVSVDIAGIPEDVDCKKPRSWRRQLLGSHNPDHFERFISKVWQ